MRVWTAAVMFNAMNTYNVVWKDETKQDSIYYGDTMEAIPGAIIFKAIPEQEIVGVVNLADVKSCLVSKAPWWEKKLKETPATPLS